MDLKNDNPQKHFIKMICDIIYYFGLGDFWYENRNLSRKQKWLYNIWAGISNLYAFGFCVNEFLANLRSDLNDKEKNDLVQFTFAHTSISAKIICSYWQKKKIVRVLERLLEGDRYIRPNVDKACVQRSMWLCITVVGVSYTTLTASTVDGIRAHITDGIPIRTEVTYYPTILNTGTVVNLLRFFIHLHWWFIVTIMAAIDCLCICSLVIVAFKFKALHVYFNNLREKIKDLDDNLEEEYRKDLVDGIKLHEDALWCAKNVQYALGVLYSVQVFESVVLLVMCLVKLVAVERNLIFLLANFAYIFCLIVLTGAYMMAGGDVTYQASEMATSIFHSGWELVPRGSDLRVLVVVALQRSQVPVYMFAYGVITLNYSNFISVIRSSYSFFAVMY